jgi:hypothetical protein
MVAESVIRTSHRSIFTQEAHWMCTVRFIIYCYVGNTIFDDSRDSAVGVATSYGLDGPSLESR